MQLNEILAKAVALGASDIHLKTGIMPVVRIHGNLLPLETGAARLTAEQIAEMAAAIMSTSHRKRFSEIHEVDMGYGVSGLGRFRINIFQQRGTVGMVIRHIPVNILSLEQLNLPKGVKKMTTWERGIVLVTGMTGSGKSTTLASMIDFINQERNAHILTIEDPIEFLIRDKRSIVNQRELGLDTPSFAMALRQALRQDPDIILLGEMRDAETIKTALLAAETGHLVFSTLHTTDARETINRILSVFEPHEQTNLRHQLASNLRGVVSQRLIPKADGVGVVPACEIMVVNARIRDMILDPLKTIEIPLAIEEGVESFDMQSFDQSLMDLCTTGKITAEEARAASSNPDDFALRLKGIVSMDGKRWSGFDKNDTARFSTIKGIEVNPVPVIPGEKTPMDEEPNFDELDKMNQKKKKKK